MKKILFFLFLPFVLPAQNLHIELGTGLGISLLEHHTDFQNSGLYDLYIYDRDLFAKQGVIYTWEDFEKDHQLKSQIWQPKYVFFAEATYKNLPFYLEGSISSSTSSLQKMAFGGTLGMKYRFDLSEKDKIQIKGGYKFVLDKGFGTQTLVNSIGDDVLRKDVSTFFNPVDPLGKQDRKLMVLNFEYYRIFQKFSCGIRVGKEVDLTTNLESAGKMTNSYGIVFLKMKI